MADFLKSATKPVANTIFSEADKPKKTEGDKSKKGAGDSNKNIQLNEFFWDQFITYLATAIALLTFLDASLQFFRSNGGLHCYIPMDLLPDETTRDNAAYVNTFCAQSLTWSEYYSIFILIQGILLVAPHYLWGSIFSGRFDFFVDLVRQLDRLRDSDTGDYKPKNIEIVKKLEQEFPENWKWSGIFVFYIIKLAVQLLVVVASIVINIAVFPEEDFSFVFSCPRDFNGSTKGWSLPDSVECAYPSFRVLSKIQIVDYILLVLALGAALFGLLWCFKRHPSSLGYKTVAKFAFSSCLPPDEYVCESVWRKPRTFFTPRIRNDLDFLVMRLFRADTGHGRVFKDIQVSKEIRNLVTRDHVLLHLFNDAIKDQARKQRRAGNSATREKDIRQHFIDAGFDQHPEAEVFQTMMGEGKLGNMTFEPIGGLRNRMFGFFQFAKENKFAYDIAFGSVGCPLILARGFKEVVSVNFNPFYRNAEEVVRKEVFQVNYSSVTLQQDIFAQKTENLRLTDEAVDDEIVSRDPESRAVIETKLINFIVVGPFVGEATKGTVNLHIERMNTGRYFEKNAVLLALRPVEIAGTDVSSHFCKYEPAKELFILKKDVQNELREKFVETSPLGPPAVERPAECDPAYVPVTCADVDCLYEFIMYSFTGGPEEQPSRGKPPRLSKHPPPQHQSNSPPHQNDPCNAIVSLNESPYQSRSGVGGQQTTRQPPNNAPNLITLSPVDPELKDNRAREQHRINTSAFNPLSEMASPPDTSGPFNFSQSVYLPPMVEFVDGQSASGRRSVSSAPPGTPV